jgi:O-antigen/teichoic acid export membrane protein
MKVITPPDSTQIPPEAVEVADPVAGAPEGEMRMRTRVLRGSMWTVGGFGFQQIFRFGSNLALAYLLGEGARESFGLMAMVSIVMVGLQMFSDIGIWPAIIHSKRGEDIRFLNTAWTIGVIRGFVLWATACAFAVPASWIWYPELLYILPVAAVGAAISGFLSTNLILLNRQIVMGRLTLLELSTQLIGITVMVGWALVHPSVWALVAGTLVTTTFKTIGSHVLMPGPGNRFGWHRESVREIFSFGKWITLSTIITFFAAQIEKLTFARLMPAAMMGVYWQGFQLAEILPQLSRHMGGAIGFPALADLHRRDRDRFLWRLLHLRMVLAGPINVGLLLLIATVQPLVYIIYPAKFAWAGWIAQVLAVNSLAAMVNATYGNAFMAVGRTFYNMIVVSAILVVMVVSPLTGYFLEGSDGFLMGIAISQWLLYPLYAILAKRCGFWQPRFDIGVLLTSAGLVWAAVAVSNFLVHRLFL